MSARPRHNRRIISSWAQAATLVLAFAITIISTAVHAQGWVSRGTLNVPEHYYNFLAATPDGNLLAGTFHSGATDSPPRSLPALLIRNPQSPNPEVVRLCDVTFPTQRGYSGIASDPVSGFYVSGDTGEDATSFIRKFRNDGSPDTRFGRNGILLPNRRTLGIDVVGEYLFAAVGWGEVMVLRGSDGAFLGMLPKIDQAFVRDITIDPRSMRVFGVAEGALYTWGGGAPWNPRSYASRQLTPKSGHARAGEGISFDPIKRTILNTPIPGNILLEVEGSGRITRYPVGTAQNNSHLADSVMSFDGSTLFISDMFMRRIHVMHRDMDRVIAQTQARQSTNTVSASGDSDAAASAPPVEWNRSYTEIVQQARQQGKPMVVYFRTGEYQGCLDFERDVLLTGAYNSRAGNYINVFEDIGRDRLLAYRFGVFRVPHVVILDRNGDTMAEFSGNIRPEQIYGALEQFR